LLEGEGREEGGLLQELRSQYHYKDNCKSLLMIMVADQPLQLFIKSPTNAFLLIPYKQSLLPEPLRFLLQKLNTIGQNLLALNSRLQILDQPRILFLGLQQFLAELRIAGLGLVAGEFELVQLGLKLGQGRGEGVGLGSELGQGVAVLGGQACDLSFVSLS
jgi:hypothetical protein